MRDDCHNWLMRRLMTDDKRQHGRLPLVMEAVWEGATGKSHARTTDISEGGCFVDTHGQTAVGEMLALQLSTPDGESITVQAEVIYHLPRFGFGVRFKEISDSDRGRLKALLDQAKS